MMAFKTKTWITLLLMAGGYAALAANGAFDEPAPAEQIEAALLNGHPAAPPAFSWNDIFKGPR